MEYQKYLKNLNELSNQRDALWEIASRKISTGDQVGAQVCYAIADGVQKEIDVLMKANEEKPAANEEELTLRFS